MRVKISDVVLVVFGLIGTVSLFGGIGRAEIATTDKDFWKGMLIAWGGLMILAPVVVGYRIKRENRKTSWTAKQEEWEQCRRERLGLGG